MPLARNITAVILAGGKSTRMGEDKAYLPWKKSTLLENAKNILSLSGCKCVRVSGTQDIVDSIENIGPLGGISSCLNSLNYDGWILFWPVDVIVTLDTVQLFLQGPAKETQAVYTQNSPLPLLLKNSQNMRENLDVYLKSQKYSVKGWLKGLNSHELEEQNFQNLNTPEEYKKAINL